MNAHAYLIATLLLTGMGISGCSAVGKPKSPELLKTSSFEICPWKPNAAGLEVVRNTADWQQLLSPAQQNLGELRTWKPSFDNGHRIVVYRMGQKNSAGFSVNFGTPSLLLGNQLRLPLMLNTPPAGSMNAMVLTSPCVVGWVDVSSGTSVELVSDSSKAVISTAAL